jgi:hypothetical protein
VTTNEDTYGDDYLDRWVEELLASGDDEKLAKLVQKALSDDEERESYAEALSETLEANRELRDDNFVHPESVLVFTEATCALEEVELWRLALRYPLQQPGQRWSYEDLGKVTEAKATLYQQSRVANDLAEEDPEATPTCGTVVLVDPTRPGALCWCVVKARVLPGQGGEW